MEDTTTTSMPTYQNPSVPKTVMTPEQKEAEESMRSYLGRTMRVTLPDNRTVAGMALCIDGAGNLILQEVTETVTKKFISESGEEVEETNVSHPRSFIVPSSKMIKVEIGPAKPDNSATALLHKLASDVNAENAASAAAASPEAPASEPETDDQ